MTIFFIILLISIFVAVSLLYIIHWETDVLLGLISGALASIIVLANVTIAIRWIGFDEHVELIDTKPLNPVNGDTIYLEKNNNTYNLFSIGDDFYEVDDKRCETVHIPDTISPYCEILQQCPKRWVLLFYHEDARKSYKLFIPENLIGYQASDEIPDISIY
ncbi:MAG: hypothetical protein K6A41_08175 [Bacteroidales bacterium]|nr:hypothetical protein [Bacteroidales bacterium]